MCTSTQGDQPFNITWYRDGKPLRIGEQIVDSSASSFATFNSVVHRQQFDERTIEINTIQALSSILTIHNITSQHNGNYTCQISNTAGSVDFTAVLSVSGKYNTKTKSLMTIFIFLFFFVMETMSRKSVRIYAKMSLVSLF